MKYIIFFSIILVLVLTVVVSSAAEITGTVSAKRAKYNKDVVVYIDKIDGQQFQPPSEPAVMDQHKLTFIPRVLPVLVGTQVDFLNSDDVLHNVFSPDKAADKVNLGTYPKDEVRSKVFDKAGSAVLLCNVHPEMEAYVVAVETPYFAVTDENGKFTISDVPEGTYTLKVWSEKYRAEPMQVTVTASGITEVTFELGK
jgi:plastocyanin